MQSCLYIMWVTQTKVKFRRAWIPGMGTTENPLKATDHSEWTTQLSLCVMLLSQKPWIKTCSRWAPRAVSIPFIMKTRWMSASEGDVSDVLGFWFSSSDPACYCSAATLLSIKLCISLQLYLITTEVKSIFDGYDNTKWFNVQVLRS